MLCKDLKKNKLYRFESKEYSFKWVLKYIEHRDNFYYFKHIKRDLTVYFNKHEIHDDIYSLPIRIIN